MINTAVNNLTVDSTETIEVIDRELYLTMIAQSENHIRIDKEHNCFINSPAVEGLFQINGIHQSFLSNSEIKPNEKVLYLILKGLANRNTGVAFPNKKSLGLAMGVSDRQISNILRSMIDKYMIYSVNRLWADSRTQTSNMYIINDYDKVTGNFGVANLLKYKYLFPADQSFYFVSTYSADNGIEFIAVNSENYQIVQNRVNLVKYNKKK